MNSNDTWEEYRPDGTHLVGGAGWATHIHETGVGTGVVTVETQPKEHIPFNNFVREVDAMLPPDWRIQ